MNDIKVTALKRHVSVTVTNKQYDDEFIGTIDFIDIRINSVSLNLSAKAAKELSTQLIIACATID